MRCGWSEPQGGEAPGHNWEYLTAAGLLATAMVAMSPAGVAYLGALGAAVAAGVLVSAGGSVGAQKLTRGRVIVDQVAAAVCWAQPSAVWGPLPVSTRCRGPHRGAGGAPAGAHQRGRLAGRGPPRLARLVPPAALAEPVQPAGPLAVGRVRAAPRRPRRPATRRRLAAGRHQRPAGQAPQPRARP